MMDSRCKGVVGDVVRVVVGVVVVGVVGVVGISVVAVLVAGVVGAGVGVGVGAGADLEEEVTSIPTPTAMVTARRMAPIINSLFIFIFFSFNLVPLAMLLACTHASSRGCCSFCSTSEDLAVVEGGTPLQLLWDRGGLPIVLFKWASS